MSIPQPPFTPSEYELYLKTLNNQDFNEEVNTVSQDWVNLTNELTTLQEDVEANADRIQEFQYNLTIIEQKQKLLNKHQSLRDLADMYLRSNLSTVEAAFLATQAAINAIQERNRDVKVFPIEDMTLLEQEQALLEILHAELARRK